MAHWIIVVQSIRECDFELSVHVSATSKYTRGQVKQTHAQKVRISARSLCVHTNQSSECWGHMQSCAIQESSDATIRNLQKLNLELHPISTKQNNRRTRTRYGYAPRIPTKQSRKPSKTTSANPFVRGKKNCFNFKLKCLFMDNCFNHYCSLFHECSAIPLECAGTHGSSTLDSVPD